MGRTGIGRGLWLVRWVRGVAVRWRPGGCRIFIIISRNFLLLSLLVGAGATRRGARGYPGARDRRRFVVLLGWVAMLKGV